MIIKPGQLTRAELRQVAELHRHSLAQGFLAQLNPGLLTLIYTAIDQYPHSFLIVAKDETDDGQVTGFITGVEDIGKFYKWFIIRKFLQGGILLLPYLFNLKKIKRMLEILVYPSGNRQSTDTPKAELLSLGVGQAYRQRGIAAKLYARLCEEFTTRNIAAFSIMVGGSLLPAQKFYEKMGAERHSKIKVHADEVSLLYIHQLK